MQKENVDLKENQTGKQTQHLTGKDVLIDNM